MLKNSAEQGLSKSQSTLGQMYYLGDGVEQNIEKALMLLSKAAEQNDTVAQFYLATLYFGQENYEQAVKWHKEAAMQGDPDAQLMLGMEYALGQGTPKDVKEGYAWVSLAAQKGIEGAQEAKQMIAKELSVTTLNEAEALFHEYQKRYSD